MEPVRLRKNDEKCRKHIKDIEAELLSSEKRYVKYLNQVVKVSYYYF